MKTVIYCDERTELGKHVLDMFAGLEHTEDICHIPCEGYPRVTRGAWHSQTVDDIEKLAHMLKAAAIESIETRCPGCGTWHVDEGEWEHKPHRTHLCAACGKLWRPSEKYTRGVLPRETWRPSDLHARPVEAS